MTVSRDDNGSVRRLQDLSTRPGEGDPAEELALLAAEQTLSDLDQTQSDADQTASDSDQTACDSDQTASEADQDAADRDEHASARDQAVADREHAHASLDAAAERAYGISRAERAGASAEREASALRRAATSLERTRAAIDRDEAARRRDITALARDQAADARDRAAELKEASAVDGATPDPALAAVRKSAQALRAKAAADRARAAVDRARAASDRARAADDRRQARIDLRRAHLDDLTGAYTRGLGLLTLQHEVERAHRSRERFVLAFIAVDGLKQVNDRRGHAVGDGLLRTVAAELRSQLRSYDPIVRVGGDEFVCAFSNTAPEPAAARMERVRQALTEAGGEGSISFGLAELRSGESVEGLIARGDAELYRVKQGRYGERCAPQVTGSQNGTSCDRLLGCGPASAGEARAAVGELSDRLQPELLQDLGLVVSELVTNSVEHGPAVAGGSIRLLLLASVERVRAEVQDAGHGFTPPLSPPDADASSGRGLWVVDQLADSWGVKGGESTSVWVEFDPKVPPDGETA